MGQELIVEMTQPMITDQSKKLTIAHGRFYAFTRLAWETPPPAYNSLI